MKNTHITWIFGSSASGKSTFINHLINNLPKELLQRIGFANKSLFVCKESIDIIAQYEGDPLGDQREKIVDSIIELANNDGVILVKGQDLDLEENRPRRIKEALPECNHSIIFLHSDISVLFERFKNKPWWTEHLTISVFKEWLNEQIEMLIAIQKDFEILTLDSGTKLYEEIEFPKVI